MRRDAVPAPSARAEERSRGRLWMRHLLFQTSRNPHSPIRATELHYNTDQSDQSRSTTMSIWQFQEAKAKLSEVVRLAATEPQEITFRGEPAAVVLSIAEYQRLKSQKHQLPLGQFLMNSPLAGLDLDFSRDQSLPREVSLD